MKFEDILNDYLTSIKDLKPDDTEHSKRTPLQTFFESTQEYLSQKNKNIKDIKITHEPKRDKGGLGSPDFLVETDSMPLGYIENKKINEDLNKESIKNQIRKYLNLSPNIMLTDYLTFKLFGEDKGKEVIKRETKIIAFENLKNFKSTQKTQLLCDINDLENLLELFFTHNPKQISSAKEFANALAVRSSMAKDFLIGQKDNQKINGIFEIFKQNLYHELSYEEFCDSFTQSLTYSLFLAKLNANDHKIELDGVGKWIPTSFPLIREISRFLKDIDNLEDIKWLIKEILNIINNIDANAIVKELNGIRDKDLLNNPTLPIHKDPYLHFYEIFLGEYDKKLRELRGVYYTPYSVVRFIIQSLSDILDKDFGKKLREATLLDFATGTGTFILEAFNQALTSTNKNSPDFKNHIEQTIKNFHAFEYLIAPYIIAHLKISQNLKENFDYTPKERLKIYLTNTLLKEDTKQEQNKLAYFQELIEESRLSQETKDKDILVITGNPPYNGSSANKYEGVRDYYFCGLDSQNKPMPINEKNPKWLQDDYVKFIHFAQKKIDKLDKGAIGIITNNAFLDNATFRGMRWNLLNSFDEIYILNLHGNTRKKEVAPDGGKDENVFDIMQGVSINLFIKKSKKDLYAPPPRPPSAKYTILTYGAKEETNINFY